MTVTEMIGTLTLLVEHGLDPNSIVKSYNGDEEAYVPVTGFLYGDGEVELQTDDCS